MLNLLFDLIFNTIVPQATVKFTMVGEPLPAIVKSLVLLNRACETVQKIVVYFTVIRHSAK